MSAAASDASKPVITFFDAAEHHPAAESEGLHYAGTATFDDGSTAKISIQMTSETLSGLSGTAIIDDTRPGAVRHLFVLRGTATRTGVFTLYGVATGECTAVVNGMMSRDWTHGAGQFIMTALGKPASAGTFTASRQ